MQRIENCISVKKALTLESCHCDNMNYALITHYLEGYGLQKY